jgi:cell division protein FtsA
MKRNIAVGIDVGTYKVKVVVAEGTDDKNRFPKILGTGFAESKGLRHGYIMHQSDAIRSIRKAVRQAEKSSKVKINKAFLSISGRGLGSHTSTGTVMISRADNEITDLDIEKVLQESQEQIPSTLSVNKKIIHQIPIEYKIDGKVVMGNPVGMKGVKLEAKVLFVNCMEHHLQELIQAVEDAGVEIIDVMASPLAASLVALSKTEKMVGCVLANIGSETVSIVTYENDIPVSLEVFPIGSSDITNDIALGFKVSLEEAEKIKYEMDHDGSTTRSKRQIDDIITARLKDIFELIEAHLKKIDKHGILPAGIVITGGGSGVSTIEDMAKASLKLPSKVTNFVCDDRLAECVDDDKIKIKEATWSVAYGLCVFGLYADSDQSISNNVGKMLMKSTRNKLLKWIKQFLP